MAVVIAAGNARGAVPEGNCEPPPYVTRAIRAARRVDLVRLGPAGRCESNPLERDLDPVCFVGFPRTETFFLFPDDGGRAGRMLAAGNLACRATGTGDAAAYTVGFDFQGRAGAVRVLLQVPSGAVVFEIPNGRRFDAALKPAGLREWRRLVASMADRMGRKPSELEDDLARDMAPPPPVVAAPAAAAPGAAASPYHPVVPEVVAEAITKVSPVYPDIAREAGVDGVVGVSALVGTDGRVHEVRVVKSIPMLDAAACAAVRQWSFQPGTRQGKAVDSWCDVPVKFSLH